MHKMQYELITCVDEHQLDAASCQRLGLYDNLALLSQELKQQRQCTYAFLQARAGPDMQLALE